MPGANIVFNVPGEMTLDQPSEIRLLLSRNRTPSQLEAEIKRAVAGVSGLQGARIAVSDKMEARLTGQGFEIIGATYEAQPVGTEGETVWQWDVVPTKEGILELHLTLSAILSVNGSSVPMAIRVFDRKIRVKVTWRQRISGFLTRNWKWLWTVVLIPVGRWLWKRRQKKPAAA
jgi:hypothetical protein